MYICTREPSKNRFRVRLQISIGTIRASDQTAKTKPHEVLSPHPFVLELGIVCTLQLRNTFIS